MRLLIIANRLPISLDVRSGTLEVRDSAGGLATGLSTFLGAWHGADAGREHVWVGWPGCAVPDSFRTEATQYLGNQNLAPVFLNEEEQDAFYYGFCNDTIWPLFHSFPSLVEYDAASWDAYVHVNERFAEQIADMVRQDDTIWIHDYQLMLVPKLLRERLGPDVPIGFFLHTPFPTFEIFRLLPKPWKRSILKGLLGADIVGFHTYDYAQYFAGCVERILGYERTAEAIHIPGRTVQTQAFPIGIDFRKFHDSPVTAEVEAQRALLTRAVGDRKLILSIDRLDYTKGITNRLLAYEQFLSEHPEYQNKVTLALVVIPSREEVPRYAGMKRKIDGLVGRINGRFGALDWTPILYQYSSLPFRELSALYSESDVALVTPLRDGMNMIAKEYIASRRDQTGVLVLSELAGAAHELGEAVLINPNHQDEITEALFTALTMPTGEQVQNNTFMQERLRQYDIVRWGNDFLDELALQKQTERTERRPFYLGDDEQKVLQRDFADAKRRLLLLDYDGTLVPFAKNPLLAQPDDDLLRLLSELTALRNTQVAVLSGRSKETLDTWLGSTGALLSAEHGAWIKDLNGWRVVADLDTSWKEVVLPILETYVDRIPGTFVEKKEYSLVWHYRNANPAMANMRAKELVSTLRSVTSGMKALVQTGSKIVEVRAQGVDKGSVATLLHEAYQSEFILALGDDTTDEDMFRALPETAYTVKVRQGESTARYSTEGPIEVRALLKTLSGGLMDEGSNTRKR